MAYKPLRLLLLLLVSFSWLPASWGQGATTAAMSGTILDSKGEALLGATVVAVHTPTNTTYSAPANGEGRFNIQGMRVGGPYTVRVTFVGYQDFTREGINLTLAENFRLDARLSEATIQLAEAVVTGRQNSVINTDRTGASTTIQRQQLERLPTLNRSFADFTRLTPQAGGAAAGGSFGGRNNLYNNVTIDGAVFNNSFGLGGNGNLGLGQQTNAQPISLDAIDQIQVSIAPYDVRQGSFTGASINAVTRSGTNKFSASIYGFYRDQKYLGQDVADVHNPLPTFNLKNFGARVGGPLIKDKLFFFVNAERELRQDPPSPNYTAFAGATGPTVSQVSQKDLDALSGFLTGKYGYNPGPYQDYQLAQNSDKFTAKLDWNISPNHRFNIKYNYLKSYKDVPPSGSGSISNRTLTSFGLPFLGAYYRINNNLNSVIAELNSTFGTGRFANNLTVGYLAGRDIRQSGGGSDISPFPLVDIGNASGLSSVKDPVTGLPVYGTSRVTAAQTLTSFGTEPFSVFNRLDTDTYQFGDNFTAFLGKHNLTVGTYNELYKFTNGFAPQYYGAYVFNSLEDFYASARTTDAPNGYYLDANRQPQPYTGAAGQGPTRPLQLGAQRYQLRYSALSDGSFPFAVTKAAQLGLYVQDEWSPLNNLKLTYGLRADLPVVYSDIPQNTALANLTGFRDGVRLNTGQVPNKTLLFSPRVGFNWDVHDDRKTQVRGGTGIFTGRVPFVWISNQASNNGVQFGSIDLQGAAANAYAFNPDVNKYRTFAGANTQYNVAVTARDFKFPQVYRSNLALDHGLPGGVVATVEGLYTKDLNAVYFQNVNLPVSTVDANVPAGVTDPNAGDRRPIYYTTNAAGALAVNNRIYGGQGGATAANPNITDAILLNNTSRGYSYSLTAQLQKTFSKGLYAMAAYTYSDSRSVNDGGSIAQSSWAGRPVSGDPNADVMGYSQYLVRHRVIGSLSYRFEYLQHLGTTVSLFYEGSPAGRYSYTYGGDMNGDGVTGNDLIYVPRNASEIVLVDRRFASSPTGAYTYSAAQQAADLDAFISADPYLSQHRGQYAERNGAEQPWQHRVDFRLLQDVFTNLGENRHALQLSLDVFNIGNLLNKNWGIYQFPYTAQPLAFQGYNAQGQPTFQFQYATNPTATTPAQTLTTTFRNDVSTVASRWQLQLGLRYLFN